MTERRYGTLFGWARQEHGLTKFLDAFKALKFQVSDTICSKAIRKDPLRCPIKLAVVEQEGRGQKGIVDAAIMRSHAMIVYLDANRRKVGVRYRVDGRTREALIQFDRTGVFEPGTYSLQGMPPSERIGKKRVGKRGRAIHPRILHQIPGTRFGVVVKERNVRGEKR